MSTMYVNELIKKIYKSEKFSIFGLRGVGKSSVVQEVKNILEEKGHSVLMINGFVGYAMKEVRSPDFLIIDDAHLISMDLLTKILNKKTKIILTSLNFKQDFSDQHMILKPLPERDIETLLNDHQIPFERGVPSLVSRLLGGFLSYINIAIGAFLYFSNRTFLSKRFLLQIVNHPNLKKLFLSMARDYLMSYYYYLDQRILDYLRAAMNGNVPEDAEYLFRLGLLKYSDSEDSVIITDPFIRELIKNNIYQQASKKTKKCIVNPGFSKFYPLNDDGYIVIYNRALIGVLYSNIEKHLRYMQKIARITFSDSVFLVIPRDISLSENSKYFDTIKIFRIDRKNFFENAKKQIDHIISFIQGVNEFPNIAHNY